MRSVKKLLSITILALLTFSTLVNLTVQAQSFNFGNSFTVVQSYATSIDTQALLGDVAPGDAITLNVILLSNVSGSFFSGYAVLQGFMTSYIEPYGNDEAKYVLSPKNSLNKGDVIQLKFNLYIHKETPLGTYVLILTLKYVLNSSWHEESYPVSLDVKGRPEVVISAQVSEASPGLQKLRLAVKNNGSASAYDVNLKLSSQSIAFINSTLSLGSIAKGDVKYVDVWCYIPRLGTQEALTTITAVVSYRSSSNMLYSVTQPITIKVKPTLNQVITLKTNTTTLYAGTLNPILLTIVNEGPYNVSNVRIVVTPQQTLNIVGNRTYLIKSLNVGSYETIALQLYPNPSKDTVTTQLIVYLEYIDSLGVTGSLQNTLSFTVLPYLKKNIGILTINSSAKAPGDNNITLEVVNLGQVVLRNISITVKEDLQVAKVRGGSLLIDELKPGEVKTFSFRLEFYSVFNGVLTIPITLTYIDVLGFSYVETPSLTLVVKPVRPGLTFSLTNATIYAQSIAKLDLIVSNAGDSDIYNLTLKTSLSGASAQILNPQYVAIKELRRGNVVNVPLTLVAFSVQSSSVLTLTIQYEYYDVYYNKYVDTASLNIILMPTQESIQPLVEVNPTTFKTLNNASVNICVENPLNSELYNVVVDLTSISPLIPLTTLSSVNLGVIKPTEAKCLNIPVLIPNVLGSYTLTLSLRYSDVLGITYSKTYVRGFTIEPSKILVEVNSFPKNIYTPGSSNLTLTVRNSGDVPLKNVLVNVGTSAQLIPITPTTYYLGDLNPNESMNITLLVKATAVAGQTASLNVELQYSDITGKTYTQSRSLPIELTPVSLYKPDIYVEPNELLIGEANPIYVTIFNNREYPLLNAELSLTTSANVVILNGSNLQLGDLSGKAEKKIKLVAYVTTTTSTTATITVNLIYVSGLSGSTESVSEVKTVLLRSLPRFVVTDAIVTPQTVTPGQLFTLTITITNRGPSSAYSVRATPSIGGLPLRTISSATVYVGTVDSDRSATFSFTFTLLNVTNLTMYRYMTRTAPIPNYTTVMPGAGVGTRTAPFNYVSTNVSRLELVIPITITYGDNLRAEHNMTVYVPVTISLNPTTTTRVSTQTQQPLTWEIVAVVSVVAVAVGFLLWRRARR